MEVRSMLLEESLELFIYLPTRTFVIDWIADLIHFAARHKV